MWVSCTAAPRPAVWAGAVPVVSIEVGFLRKVAVMIGGPTIPRCGSPRRRS